MSMGSRSWILIALVALAVTISYAEEAKHVDVPAVKASVNSLDTNDKPLKKNLDSVKWVVAILVIFK